MALIIRLRPQGKKNKRVFRVVVADERSPLKGKYIESVGLYDSHSKTYELDVDKVENWISKGARISDTVKDLLIKKKKAVA